MRDVPTLREWLQDGPFGLTMSSGFFGFFAHAGVLTVLEEEALSPVRCSGSSAGALVTAGWSAGIGSAQFKERMTRMSKADFWDPFPGFGFLRGRRFHQLLEEMFPVTTFEELQLPLALSVWDVFGWKTEVRTSGELLPAIRASCSVPGMFHPVWMDGRPYVDGGVADRPGLDGMPKEDRVLYHHLLTTARWRRDKTLPDRKGSGRPQLTGLVIQGLPKVGPNALEKGFEAFEAGYRGAKAALEQPIDDQGHVIVEL
jgi:NTE family protein